MRGERLQRLTSTERVNLASNFFNCFFGHYAVYSSLHGFIHGWFIVRCSLFHYCSSSAHYCEDHFHSRLKPQFKYDFHIFLAVHVIILTYLGKCWYYEGSFKCRHRTNKLTNTLNNLLDCILSGNTTRFGKKYRNQLQFKSKDGDRYRVSFTLVRPKPRCTRYMIPFYII